MTSPLFIFMTFITLTIVSAESEITSTSIIDSISHLLYIYLNPIFQSTFEQLSQLVFQLGEKISQINLHGLTRISKTQPAEWVSQLFGGVNSIATQWNNQITDFFANIPTIIQNHGRSSINYLAVKEKLYEKIDNLLEDLEKLVINEAHQLMTSIFDKSNLIESIGRKRALPMNTTDLLSGFQQQVSNIFVKAKAQLHHSIDDSIDFILSRWRRAKDQLFK